MRPVEPNTCWARLESSPPSSGGYLHGELQAYALYLYMALGIPNEVDMKVFSASLDALVHQSIPCLSVHPRSR